MAKTKPTVFISHAGPDKKEALKLHDALGKVGLNAHLDQEELHIGDNIVTWINNSIEESDYLLILISEHSIGRYWVETEWSAALMKEADLRRTFVIPVVLPGIQDSQIPTLLRARLFLDFRNDQESSLLQLVNRIKQDEQIGRDRGKLPTPAPMTAQNSIIESHNDSDEWIDVVVFSSRFGRKFRFTVPKKATPSYLLAMLRDTLNLKWSNIDENLFVELSYTYAIGFNGNHLSLNTPISDAGVTNGSILELWIRVTLTDLLEDSQQRSDKAIWLKGAGQETLLPKLSYFLACRTISPSMKKGKMLADDELKKESNRIIDIIMKDRNFTSAQIAMIAQKYFDHVDV
jgi:hypothetical protein